MIIHSRECSMGGVRRASIVALLAFAAYVQPALTQEGVLTTQHNLSVSGPGELRSLSEVEVCKFCHIPHNAAVPTPLWGHALSKVAYEVPSVRRGADFVPVPQPDGSSRLCLSCHDGTVALGDIVGERRPIPFAGGERMHPGRKGFLGTDLSGSHPVSFVVRDSLNQSIEGSGPSDFSLRATELLSGSKAVRLDGEGKMQCTTCHDPHSDENYKEGVVPRFWVAPTVDEVCLRCHVPR